MKITGTLIFTDEGMFSIVAPPCSNGAMWTAENCYKYINNEKGWEEHQADKLKWLGKLVDESVKRDKEWYLDKNNFLNTFEVEV
ncbi:MAG: hypothetical protein ACRDDY_03670 [Clostridium sp.]|uniref:hypothetical protein n=1 Tax=Clostridium sp. TaxID=1506 RepID=UPI003EE7CF1B